jgi:tyrosyl-tRNA synthetase
MSMDFLLDLQKRGLVHQMSSPALVDHLHAGPVTAYNGFDPTADSLHVGHLLPLVTLRRLQLAGHVPIGLVGGATAMIGDPSGRESERTLLTLEQVQANVASIRQQVGHFLDFDAGARLVDNFEWFEQVGLLDFLRDIGKHFSVNQMIMRDSVRVRLETREQGISYTEFSYMLLQSYDYLVLHDRYGCTLQTGGSDQWGNIVSGSDLIRRLRGVETHGLTMPLILCSDGRKFGKTGEGTVWLSAARTSPYQLFQFWLNVDDRDVVKYLNFFTFLDYDEIAALAQAVAERPQERLAQRRLAKEVTRLVHGEAALQRAVRATAALFSKDADFRELSAQELEETFRGAPQTALPASALGTEAAQLVSVLAQSGLYPSKGRARQDVTGGGISINNVAVRDADHTLNQNDVLPGGFIILRKGKKTYHVLRVAD